MNNTDKVVLRAAVVGCGSVSGTHGQAIRQVDGVRLVACGDTSMDASRNFGAEFGCNPYNSLEELMDAEKPDVVHICTPHHTHVPLALYAVSRGVHVLLEKPAATAASDLETLQRTMKDAPVQLGLCFQNRYNPSFVYAKNLIESGATGRILGARAFLTWNRDKEYYLKSGWRGRAATEGSSVLLNQAIHTIDLLFLVMGKPLDVAGTTANRTLQGVIDTEDTAEMVFYYNDNVRAFFYATVGYGTDETVIIEVRCEHMTLCVEGDKLTVRKPGGTVETPGLCMNGIPGGKPYWGASHALLIKDFYGYIREGKPFPVDVFSGGPAHEAIYKVLGI
ncbi:MAG: Gfo/Idh/MocA family oxidoreductase [Defluviitaleaceae bacterium]|nr:Gfo/Idh/MocA family oxidoreductase [Defluviitaleaceae bacterium]MCL2836770.1 Gfo/Idh/MocA family oxidoreductase [Defluviitaleaceae bacterium]